MDTAPGEQFGALGADSFDHTHFGLQADGHVSCLYHSREAGAFCETCAVGRRMNRVGS
jgi:hypothetical protein